MDFRYSTEQDAFRASLRSFLTHQAPSTRVREVSAQNGHDNELWRRLCAELDLSGLHVPTECGGAGATLSETAIAFAELGRALTPVPMAANTFAIEAILRLGDEGQRQRFLPPLLSGIQIGAFASVGADTASASTIRAEYHGGDTVLTGDACPVLHGHVADVVVVPAHHDGTIALYVVSAHAPGVSVTRLPSFDTTRPVARIQLAQAKAELLGAGTTDDIERVRDVARVLLAAEMLGGAEACLAMAVDYAGHRRQFDRPIGSFQAVKHTCAEMMIEIDATQAVVMYAGMTAGEPTELAITGPLAKAQAADTYLLSAGSAIQVHGGIGFTWEHDLHLHFRRARSTAALFGGSAGQRALLADRVGF